MNLLGSLGIRDLGLYSMNIQLQLRQLLRFQFNFTI